MTSTVAPALTLDDVAERFDQWRLLKKSGEKIPSELWDLAKSLKGHYKISHIGKRLHLSASQMRREGVASPSAHTKQPSPKKDKFVNVQFDSVLPSAGVAQPDVILKRPDGMQLTLSQPSTKHLSLLIKSFIK